MLYFLNFNNPIETGRDRVNSGGLGLPLPPGLLPKNPASPSARRLRLTMRSYAGCADILALRIRDRLRSDTGAGDDVTERKGDDKR